MLQDSTKLLLGLIKFIFRILEPLVYGDYPFTMKSLIRNGLPTFSDEEKSLVQNSFDFIGCNYYTSRYASSIPFNPNETPTDPDQFQSVNLTGAPKKRNFPFPFSNISLNRID